MANEMTITISITYQKGNSGKVEWVLGPKKMTISGDTATFGQIVSIGTSEEAIPLGETVAAGAWIVGLNLDDTNYFEIRDATGAGNDVVKVPAGEPFAYRFGSDVTAPFWVANTAATKVRFALIPA